MKDIDLGSLAAILREAAKQEIMPRFRQLAEGQIRQKTSVVDLVTEADEAAERFIQAECRHLIPNAEFIGEEGVAEDPSLLDRVGEAELAIIVDPIDGTANFAAGAPIFGVMAAVVSGGETVAGIIYDPLGDDFVIAERGSGAFLKAPGHEAKRLSAAGPLPVAEMIGCAAVAHLPVHERSRLLSRLAETRILVNYRCAAQEYRIAASSGFHFLLYQRLMPWDHLAGALILQEAGAHVRRLDGSVYRPPHLEGGLLIAPDEASWVALHDLAYPKS